MQMNPRPAKSLNQRPTKQLGGSAQNTSMAAVPTQPSVPINQNSYTQPQQPVTQLTKGVQVQQQTEQPAFMGQRAPATNNATVVADTGTTSPVLLFVEQMRNLVSSFAILSDEVISQNVKMALGGFPAEDRTMPYEVVDYLMANMGFIFMGLVLDENFKNAFTESLKVELQIDSQPDNVKAATREKMRDPKNYKSRGSMVIGTSDFVPEVKTVLAKKLQNSFSALDGFADEFDAEINHLTREQKLEYGFIFSNFMYLARAFTHNDLFMSYVISVIEKVKAMTGNK